MVIMNVIINTIKNWPAVSQGTETAPNDAVNIVREKPFTLTIFNIVLVKVQRTPVNFVIRNKNHDNMTTYIILLVLGT